MSIFEEEMDDLHVVAQAMNAAGNHDEGVFHDALKYYREHGNLDKFDFTVDYQDAMLRAYEGRVEELARQQDEWFEERSLISEEVRREWKVNYRPSLPTYEEGEEPF